MTCCESVKPACFETTGCLFDELIPKLSRVLPDCLEDMQREYLQEALEQFCQDSRIWRFMFESVELVAGEQVYQLPIQDGTQVVKVERVFYLLDGTEYPMPELKVIGGNAQGWYESEPSTLVFNSNPEQSETLRIVVSLKPVRTSHAFPKTLWDAWKLAIQAGALYELYTLPNMSWSSLERAAFHKQQYDEGVLRAQRVHRHNLKPFRPTYNPNQYWG